MEGIENGSGPHLQAAGERSAAREDHERNQQNDRTGGRGHQADQALWAARRSRIRLDSGLRTLLPETTEMSGLDAGR